METQYNQLLSTSKTVGEFYENVYAPVLQTLPWIDNGKGLNTASEKVLGNLAFPAYELSSYKSQKESQQAIERLRARCNELESIYNQMQAELRPLLDVMPAQDRTWEKLQEMVPKWKSLNSSNLLPYSMHKAVEDSFAPPFSARKLVTTSVKGQGGGGGHIISTHDAVLGKLMADKIKALHAKGESDHAIAVTFGSDGLWLDRGFLNKLR